MRFNRKGKKNGPRVKSKPGSSLVSYCPVDNQRVSVTEKARFASCKAGHKWVVRQ